MKKIIPFNNIVLCQLLEKERQSPVILPGAKEGRFIRIRIIQTGILVSHLIKREDICIANNLFEVLDPSQPDIGLINEKDILAKEVENAAQS